jgi:hypothetical protein
MLVIDNEGGEPLEMLLGKPMDMLAPRRHYRLASG